MQELPLEWKMHLCVCSLRVLVNEHLCCVLFVTLYITSLGEVSTDHQFVRSFTFLFTSWMVHKFFIWASTDPRTNIFNSCIVWLLSTATGSQTANWKISVVGNCNADISSKVNSFSRAKLLNIICMYIYVIDFDSASGLNARLFRTLRRRNFETDVALRKRIKCFPSTWRQRNLKTH